LVATKLVTIRRADGSEQELCFVNTSTKRAKMALICEFKRVCSLKKANSCAASLLALRRDARILKIPPYLCALLIVVGVAWLLVLPLNEYSRNTYVSENALLPGQVHTYFSGSEHEVFRAYRQEVAALPDLSIEEYAYTINPTI